MGAAGGCGFEAWGLGLGEDVFVVGVCGLERRDKGGGEMGRLLD